MLTIIAEFAPPLERVWEVYADPRQLEQIWGGLRPLSSTIRSNSAAESRST